MKANNIDRIQSDRSDTIGSADRYADNWVENFTATIRPFLRPDMTILDVGSGQTPALPVKSRPRGCRYVGLDISPDELLLAPAGSYDQTHISDLRIREDCLLNQIDLAISWQVLEHIEPLGDAISNIHSYLRPDGQFVALLSGRNAFFSIINRHIPPFVGEFAMKHLLDRAPETVFHAHYDSCTYTGLTKEFSSWTDVEVVPLYRGGGYLGFLSPARKLYLKYEDWAVNSGRKDLATHYLVVARK